MKPFHLVENLLVLPKNLNELRIKRTAYILGAKVYEEWLCGPFRPVVLILANYLILLALSTVPFGHRTPLFCHKLKWLLDEKKQDRMSVKWPHGS